jgi:hypothetical protein
MEERMNCKQLTGAILIIVLAHVMSSTSAFADDKTDVVAAVNWFLQTTGEKALSVCDSPVSIIDEFPPYEWHGPTACADWWKALNTYNEKNEIADGSATLGTPWNLDIKGDRAYYVAPMTYIYKRTEKALKSQPLLQSR